MYVHYLHLEHNNNFIWGNQWQPFMRKKNSDFHLESQNVYVTVCVALLLNANFEKSFVSAPLYSVVLIRYCQDVKSISIIV